MLNNGAISCEFALVLVEANGGRMVIALCSVFASG
jgi:hypothetical protein